MTADGILVVDKPEHISSAQLVAQVKKIVRANKIGHTGTLDPFATGVMICCLNRATRLARFFLHTSKTYQAVIRLGIETDTLDCTGNVISTSEFIQYDDETIRQVVYRFMGKIQQVPPVYSALKHEGVPLYKLARKGKPIQKPPKEVQISEITVTGISLPDIYIQVTCSGGTYLRSLASDIGKTLGCGAHLAYLRRIAYGGFSIQDAISLQALQQEKDISNRVISMSDALKQMFCYTADDDLSNKLKHGKQITTQDIQPPDKDGAWVKVVNRNNELLAILAYENHQYKYCGVFH